MFRFINPLIGQSSEPIGSVNTKTLQDLIDNQVFRVKEYYQSQNIQVDNNHPLAVMFDLISPSTHSDLEDLVDTVNERVSTLARRFDFYHLSNPNAKPTSGLFYHDGVKEYIYLDESYFDVNLCFEGWQKVAPIKIHTHPFTDNNLTLCNGTSDSPEGGSAVITINMAMLIVQWRGWLQSSTENKGNLRHFLFTYPIVNMLKAHTDIAIINRTINRMLGKPVMGYKREHPILTVDYYKLLDEKIDAQIKVFKTRKRHYHEVFTDFKTYFKPNWFNYLAIKNIPPMRTTRWLLTINNLRYAHFYLSYYEQGYMVAELQILANIKRDILTMHLDKSVAFLDNHSRLMWDDCLRILQNHT